MSPTRAHATSSMPRLRLTLLLGLIIPFTTFGLESDHHYGGFSTHGAGLGLDPAFGSEATGQQDNADSAVLSYKPIFNALKEAWSGKQKIGATSLSNNRPSRQVITPGATHSFNIPLNELVIPRSAEEDALPPSYGMQTFEPEELHKELRKRDGTSHRVYLTLSVCALPKAKLGTTGVPPDLSLTVSNPASRNLDEGLNENTVNHIRTSEGYASFTAEFSGDARFEVSAPDAPGYTGVYAYEVTASIDGPYTDFNDYQSLRFVDSDHQAVMFTTTDLTNPGTKDETAVDAWMATGAPFSVFVYEKNDPNLVGLRKSYCGLAESSQMHSSSLGARTRITTLGGIAAKQEFYVPGLKAGTSYSAVLGLPSNFTKRGPGVPTGGGMVWRQAEFQTNQLKNCRLISGLQFCDAVNYAVPAPASDSIDVAELAKTYDTAANKSHHNFSLSLQQIACKTDPESNYSLATSCEKCDAAYKSWVCAITIPRCADSSTESNAYIPRNASESPRNRDLNIKINPGPHKELPPCGSLCYGMVQNCPSALEFQCPTPNTWEYNQTYGYLDPQQETCNTMNTNITWGLNGSGLLQPSLTGVLLAAIIASAASFLDLV